MSAVELDALIGALARRTHGRTRINIAALALEASTTSAAVRGAMKGRGWTWISDEKRGRELWFVGCDK